VAQQTVIAATQTAVAQKIEATQTAEARTSVRPSGQIVFTSSRLSKADLYTMASDGSGDTRRITLAGGWYPSYSRGSNRIVFASERNNQPVSLYTIFPDGSEEIHIVGRPDTPSWEPSFSPDGQKVAFVSPAGETVGIYVMDVNRSNPPQLMTANGAGNWAPAWSPDGQHIAYVSDFESEAGKGEIWRMNVDGSNPIRLTQDGAEADRPAWSPDGRTIAYTSYQGTVAILYLLQVYEGKRNQSTGYR